MNLNNYYWFFRSALSSKFCDRIIKRALKEKDEVALIGGASGDLGKTSKKQINDLKKIRRSNIAWLDDPWIYKKIHPYIHTANRNAGWNYEWDYSETCQFTKYKTKQFYDWHCDAWPLPYGAADPELHVGPVSGEVNKHKIGKIRKLSVTVSLSDPKDYKGGELEFDFRNMNPDKEHNRKICTEILPRGSIVVFPSHVWHRVRPVTKGVRYSLVIWNLGYPFK